jgi:hypothetical protein
MMVTVVEDLRDGSWSPVMLARSRAKMVEMTLSYCVGFGFLTLVS